MRASEYQRGCTRIHSGVGWLGLFNSSGTEVGAFGEATNPDAWSIDAQLGDATLRAANGRLIFSTENVAFPPYPTYPARMVILPSRKITRVSGEYTKMDYIWKI